MKIFMKVLLFSFLSAGLILCCPMDEIKKEIANAHISCQTNDSCTATCYKGYLFPVGKTKELLTCQNSSWMPKPLSCKRIPVVVVEYYTDYELWDMPVSSCDNISRYLNNSKENLEMQFTSICSELGLNYTTNFSFSALAFRLRVSFYTKFTNATGMHAVNVCINLTRISFWNKPVLGNLLENITCGNLELNYKSDRILKDTIRYEICYDNNTFVRNVTVMSGNTRTIERYCDSLNTLPTETSMTTSSVETVSKSEFSESTNYRMTEIGTTASITAENSSISTSSFNGPLSKSPQDDTGIKQIVYIAAPAGGCLVLIVIVIAVIVCRTKRIHTPNKELAAKNNLQKQHKGMDMTVAEENVSQFKGEMIENELYQSADEDYKGDINNENRNIRTSALNFPVSEISKKEFQEPMFRENEETKEDYLYSEVKRPKQNNEKI